MYGSVINGIYDNLNSDLDITVRYEGEEKDHFKILSNVAKALEQYGNKMFEVEQLFLMSAGALLKVKSAKCINNMDNKN